VEHHPPKKLESILHNELEIKDVASGKEGLLSLVETILKYSVNTWDQGFLDKLYGSTNAVRQSVQMVHVRQLTRNQGRLGERVVTCDSEHQCEFSLQSSGSILVR
jgi:glutamate decarboxylase